MTTVAARLSARPTQTASSAVGETFARVAGRRIFYAGVAATSLTTFRVAGFTLGDVLLFASLAFALVVRLEPGAARGQVGRWTSLAVWLIVIGGMASTFGAVAPASSLLVVSRIVIVAAVIPWQASMLLTDRTHIAKAMGWFAIGGAICGAGSILQGFLGVSIPGSYITEAGRFPGFSQNVSDTGGITCVATLLCLLAALNADTIFWRIFWIGPLVCAAVGLVLSGSVAGLIAVAVGGLVLTVRRALKLRYLALAIIVGYVTVRLASGAQAQFGALSPYQRALQVLGLTEDGRYATSESRLNTYGQAVDKILQNPIIGQGMDGASGVVNGGFQVHNILLAGLYQGGLLVFAGLIVAIARPFGRWLSTDRTALTNAALAAATAAIFFSMTAPSMFNRYLWIPLALLGLLRYRPPQWAVRGDQRTSRQPPELPDPLL